MTRGLWLLAGGLVLAACGDIKPLSLGADQPRLTAPDAHMPVLPMDAGGHVPAPTHDAAPADDVDAEPQPLADAAVSEAGVVQDAGRDAGSTTHDAGQVVNPLCRLEPWHCTGGDGDVH